MEKNVIVESIAEMTKNMLKQVADSNSLGAEESKQHIHVKYGNLEYGGSIDLLQSTLAILTGYEMPNEEINEGVEMESEMAAEARVEKANAVGLEAYR